MTELNRTDLKIDKSELCGILTAKTAFDKNVLVLKKENGTLYVGVPSITDAKLLNDLSFETGLKIEPVEMAADLILIKLKELYPDFNFSKEENRGNKSSNNLSEYSNIEYVNKVIEGAIKSKASDIHFESLEDEFRIRYRVDGHLREVFKLSKNKSLALCSRLKIMANLDISEKRRPQDGRIRFIQNGNDIDIRVSSLPTNFGEKIVLRILDKSQLRLNLENLGMSSNQMDIIKSKISLPFGMILVTGPTGSGKTTSLYASLQSIHSSEKNILTVEDPVEYNIDGINQCQVKADIGFSFANALRSFLRQDPDVIMVGEVRDKETAEIAIRASLTGHLVFSTLHTNDSISCINRLIDMGIEPFLVASSVKLIIAQRLVRILCDCKKTEDIPITDRSFQGVITYKHVGCPKCNYTGYRGRTAIFELLNVSEDIAELIVQNKSNMSIRKKAIENGFTSLRESGLEIVKRGITSYEEVLRETML